VNNRVYGQGNNLYLPPNEKNGYDYPQPPTNPAKPPPGRPSPNPPNKPNEVRNKKNNKLKIIINILEIIN
jgi:hypothetical protein